MSIFIQVMSIIVGFIIFGFNLLFIENPFLSHFISGFCGGLIGGNIICILLLKKIIKIKPYYK